MTIQFGFFAGALELCLVADLVKIGVPRSAAEQIIIHFGNALPGDEEHEPMLEAATSELSSSESKQLAELEAVELAEREWELDLLEPQPEVEVPILDLHGGGRGVASETTKERVHALLVAKKLEQYAGAMAEHGYSFVDDLVEADGEELTRLAKEYEAAGSEALPKGGRSGEKEYRQLAMTLCPTGYIH